MLAPLWARLRNRSAREFPVLAVKNFRHMLASLTPRSRALRAADRAFDRRWKTDTSRGVGVYALGLDGGRAAHCHRYDPSSETMLRDPVDSLRIRPEEFTFIDYGAGKGRILMVALQMGFRTVVGIELSNGLCAIARSNLELFARQHPGMPRASIINQDAANFCPRGRKIVAYFYNPFDETVMSAVLRWLEAALRAGTEQIIVIYANPEHKRAFARPAWTECPAPQGVAIFQAGSSRAGTEPPVEAARDYKG